MQKWGKFESSHMCGRIKTVCEAGSGTGTGTGTGVGAGDRVYVPLQIFFTIGME